MGSLEFDNYNIQTVLSWYTSIAGIIMTIIRVHSEKTRKHSAQCLWDLLVNLVTKILDPQFDLILTSLFPLEPL